MGSATISVKWTVVVKPSGKHLICQLIVPPDKRRSVEEVFMDVTTDRLPLVQTACEHVALYMLSQEVPVTHILWIHHPHSHIDRPFQN